jgi:hypothetical protein
MDIDSKLKKLRVKLRHSSKKIMDDVVTRHIPKISLKDKSKKKICAFCADQNSLTKEHVLPRWTFENCTKKFFVTDINGSEQTYNKTTIPVCANCNNDLLGNIENYIIFLLKETDLSKSFFNGDQLQNIIRWLEIIEYKFHLLEIRRKFMKARSSQYLECLRDISVSVMRANIDYSPSKAVSQIRLAQKRVTQKSKAENENSLVIFKTQNENFYFFHHLNDFIFLELPKFGIAIFYFYSKKFEKVQDAKEEAMKIITSVYQS